MSNAAHRQQGSTEAAVLPAGELAHLAEDVGTARDLRGVFDALRAFALSLTGGNALFVSLLDAARRERRCVFAWGDGQELDVSTLPPLPMTDGPQARAVSTGEVVVVQNLRESLTGTPFVPLTFDVDPRDPRVSIALPLTVLGRVIGGFEIQIFDHSDPWSCVPGLQVAASLAAVAIENVRLLEGERVARANAEALQQRFALLAEVSAALGRSLDDADALTYMARLLVPRFADCCSIRLLTDGGKFRPLVAEHVDPAKLGAIQELGQRFPPSPASRQELRKVLRTCKPLLLDVSSSRPAAGARSAEHLRLLQILQPVSCMIIPLLSRGAVVGTITLMQAESQRRYDVADLLVAENLAGRAATAIDNSRLYREARRAEDDLRRLNEGLEERVLDRTTELERTVEQLKGLGEISRALNSNLNVEEVLSAIVGRAVQLSGADDGVVFEFDPGNRTLTYCTSYGLRAQDAQVLTSRSWHIGDATIVSLVARTARTVEVEDVEALTEHELLRWGELGMLQDSRRAGLRAVLVLPMQRGQDLAGVLTIRSRSPGAFPPATVELMETFAAQSTVAMQNARLFQQLQQKSQDLEIASKHKSDFLASMSHELRTPLNAIIGFAEVLLDRTPDEIPEDQRGRFLEHIQRAGKQLLGLINDILDLSKVEAGRMELFPERVALGEIIDGCVALIRVVALRKQISVETHVDPADAAVYADPTRLRQIVYNLLSNAVKFTPQGGWVSVTARVSRDVALIAVRDNGIGIKPEDQSRIFEEFRQGSARTRTSEEGTGLGLVLVRKLVELHAGRVDLESSPGRGSCFSVTLPVAGPGGDVPPSALSDTPVSGAPPDAKWMPFGFPSAF